MRAYLVGLVILFGLTLSGQAVAEGGNIVLDGMWKGKGQVVTSSGTREQASCEVRYMKYSERSYKLNAKCSTASLGVVKQIAVVKFAGSNRYKGRFDNKEYNVTGDISIVINSAGKQTATLKTKTGSGRLVLVKN